MKFYKLTYKAKEKIEKIINEHGDRFESQFSSLPDETWEETKGGFFAFISDYSTNKVKIAACVKNGDISDYKEMITDYIPEYICAEPDIEEITGGKFADYIDSSRRLNYFDDDEMKEALGIENAFCCKWGSNLEMEEDFIKSELSSACVSPDLDDEIKRIKAVGKPEIECIPVHYIIGGSCKNSEEKMLNNLLINLEENSRLTQARYTTLSVRERRFGIVNPKDAAETAKELFGLCEGGAVIIDVESNLSSSDEKRSFSYDLLRALCKACEKHARKTLFIFLLPDNNRASATVIRRLMPGAAFVEIFEDSLRGDEAKKYLSSLAKGDKIRANKALYKNLEADNTYYIEELETVYGEWHKKAIINKNFPAYSRCYEESEAKEVNETEKPAESEAYDELMSMVGLSGAKRIINESIDYFKAQKLFADMGFHNSAPSMHMVFIGSPGTAKTTAARLFARIMKDNKILTDGVFVEVGRGDLVGKYVGWTATIVKEKFRQAKGGVLFIDEAYSLVDDRDGSYGDEAINTIVQEMENCRNDTIVIFAGYPDKMEAFLNKNPGLRSRIAFHVQFDDYTPEELYEIAGLISKGKNNVLAEGVKETLIPIFEEAAKQNDFGNGRFVRNLIEKARMKQATRLVHCGKRVITREQAATLLPGDFEMPVMCAKTEKPKNAIGF